MHVRMGIFAHRKIKKDEELTFNYNVDRYGYEVLILTPSFMLIDCLLCVRHEAQPCYCGEAKCVGFIGGKTQTDLAAMDDLYLDGMPFRYNFETLLTPLSIALGIADEVEQLGLKGSKKRKGKKLDEDFIVRAISRVRSASSQISSCPAGPQASSYEGCAEGRTSYASDTKPKSSS